jgi:hypothetical protein
VYCVIPPGYEEEEVMGEQEREKARMALEDGVYRMLEAGYTADEIKAEAEYALESSQ